MIILFSHHINTVEKQVCACGFYADGELEEYLGFDILTIPYVEWDKNIKNYKLFPELKEGLQPCLVVGNNEILECTLDYHFKDGKHKGIVNFSHR